MSGRQATAVAAAAYAATAALVTTAVVRVLQSGTDPANTSAAGYLPLAYAAAAVLVAVFVVAFAVRRVDVTVGRFVPWLVGVVSALVSLVPWWAVWTSRADLGATIYRGLRVPQGTVQFWDLVLPTKSVDCAQFGFDVYAAHNGCLQDPTIYGPGVLWLRWLPFDLFSEKYVTGLGVAGILLSSLVLLWLARSSAGVGQVLLLVAAVGGPWLLLLERGNLDAVLLWGAAAVVIVVRRWDRLWAWWLAAAVIWVLGTWKYYPFAMGLMLIPALRLRRGWTVVVGYGIAALAFVVVTWDTFRFSAQSNTNMIDYGDFVVLGRVPVVARMLGTVVGQGGIQAGDAILLGLGLAAFAWGVAIAFVVRRRPVHPAMLAAGGSVVFLTAVLIAGFGYGYKATFLLLGVPLLSQLVGGRRPIVVRSTLTALLLVAVTAVVVWNTVLATIAGVTAASFLLGLSLTVLARAVWSTWARRRAQAVTA